MYKADCDTFEVRFRKVKGEVLCVCVCVYWDLGSGEQDSCLEQVTCRTDLKMNRDIAKEIHVWTKSEVKFG